MNPRLYKKEGEPVSKGDKIAGIDVNGETVPVMAQKDGVMQKLVYGKGGKIGNIPQGGRSRSPLLTDEQKKNRQIISAKYKGPEVAKQDADI